MAAAKARVLETYGKLALSFEANQGQTDSRVKFLSRGKGYTLFLTSSEAVLALYPPAPKSSGLGRDSTLEYREYSPARASAVRMKLVGASARAEVSGLDKLPGKSNYFLGNDPAKWRKNVSHYAKVRYQGVYPGIDAVYYGNQRQIEYDFIVAPGADPKAIALRFDGADKLELDSLGNLVLHTAGAQLRQQKPKVYQELAGMRQEISGNYLLKANNEVGFAVGKYDRQRPLVIDPVLIYSTFLGGSGADQGDGIAVDGAGAAYAAGFTQSADFPTTAGAYDTSISSGWDVFVTKLNADGSALVYSTFVGGSSDDFGFGMTLDAGGAVYITGRTHSSNFPTTPGAFDTSFNGGFGDGFVTKLDAAGSALVYSTFFGGSSTEQSDGIKVDATGAAYVTGHTLSTDYPTTAGAYDTSYNGGFYDVFVTKLNASGSALVYSTFVGGSDQDVAYGLALDATGATYLSGYTFSANFPTTAGAFDTTFNGGSYDAFVAKLDAAGSALVYSTFLGGSGRELAESVAVDAAGAAYVTGNTLSPDFPTSAGAFDTSFNGGLDAFVTKLNVTGSGLVYSTFLGGSADDFGTGEGIAVDSAGAAYVTGGTISPDFPTTAGAFDTSHNGGLDAFVIKLNVTGSGLVYSTYLGGRGDEQGGGIALDTAGSVYVTGYTVSADFPTTPGAFDATFNGYDAFVLKIGNPPKADTATALALSSASSTYGQSVTLTATVTSGSGAPGGTVTFQDAGAAIGTATLLDGRASLVMASLGAGPHSLEAVYGGELSFNPSISPARTLSVSRAPLTVTAADATKIYGAQLPPFSASYGGFVLGDGPAMLSGTLTFTTAATAGSAAGVYPITPGGLTSSNYAIVFVDGQLTVQNTPVSGPGRLYVANQSTNDVSVLRLSDNSLIATIPVGTNPYSVAVSTLNSRAYVANGNSNTVSVINTQTNQVVTTIPVGSLPYGIGVSPSSGHVYVSNVMSGTVSVIDPATNTVLNNITVQQRPHGLDVHPSGARVYVANQFSGTVSIINTATNSVVKNVFVGSNPDGLAVSPDGKYIYTSHVEPNGRVSVIDATTETALGTVGAGGAYPVGVAVSPNNSRVYVAVSAADVVGVIDAATRQLLTTVAVGTNPAGAVVSPDDASAYVTLSGANSIAVLDTATNTLRSTAPVGGRPYDLAVAADPVLSRAVDASTGAPAPVTITFSNVTSGGTTTLTTSTTGFDAPVGFKLGSPAQYYDLTTTATFSGPAVVCISYAGTTHGNEEKLRLFHYENGKWEDRTVLPVDTVNDVICARVTSLSPFAVFELVNAPPVAAGQSVRTRGNTALNLTLAGNDPDGDALAFSVAGQPANGTLTGTAPNLTYKPNFNFIGSDVFTFTVADGIFPAISAAIAIEVYDDTPPTINETITPVRNGSGWTTGDTTVSWTVADPESGIASSQQCLPISLAVETAGITLTCAATNGAGLSNSRSAVVKLDKTPPVILATLTPSANAAGWHKSDVTVSWSAVDPISQVLASAGCAPVTLTAETPGTVVTCSATNGAGLSSAQPITVRIDKTRPAVSTLSIEPSAVGLNTSSTLNAAATDAGSVISGVVSAEFRIEADNFSPMTASGAAFTAALPGFPESGVITVCAQASDAAGNVSVSPECRFLAIYDPEAGFVTGGGWIDSRAGAYAPNPALAGKANFGFVSRYQRGATTPSGQTEFDFKLANFNFHSTVYEWLVVAGAKAQYKGTGTVNGTGNYGFLLTATDGQVAGGGGVDKFRIKIWDKNQNGLVVYDNVSGESEDIDTANPQIIGGGSIVIHSP